MKAPVNKFYSLKFPLVYKSDIGDVDDVVYKLQVPVHFLVNGNRFNQDIKQAGIMSFTSKEK